MPAGKPQPPPPAEQARLLRHPGVVAALIAAAATIVATVLNLCGKAVVVDQPKQPSAETVQSAAVPQPAATFEFAAGPVSARLAEMRRALAHRVAGKPDIKTRRRAITALVTLSGERPPETYYRQAIDMLTQYVQDNIGERRAPGDEVEVDPRVPAYRPRDIISAIEGLQVIRRAGGGRLNVSLGSVDFHQINLEKLDLEGFYFGHADFSKAILSDCRCRGADFRHARFHGTAVWGTADRPADFRDANFLKADLAGSHWANVDFAGSNIEEAVGHKQVEFFQQTRGLTPAQRAMFQ